MVGVILHIHVSLISSLSKKAPKMYSMRSARYQTNRELASGLLANVVEELNC